MARPRAAHRSRHPARPTAGLVATPPADSAGFVREAGRWGVASGPAYLTAPVRAAHGGLCPFAATFFCFSDYLRPALRQQS